MRGKCASVERVCECTLGVRLCACMHTCTGVKLDVIRIPFVCHA